MRSKKGGLVYSTESGSMCPDCRKSKNRCDCKKKQAPVPTDGVVRLMRQTKGRKGKGVTLVTGIPAAPAELKKIARALKQKCGSGGTVKDGVVEIQGDHRDVLEKELSALGFVVKRAGG